jgi:four helix bundle protein
VVLRLPRNHRAACRGRSHQEFAAKIGIVVEEADETLFWLQLLAESGVINTERLSDLMQEAKELTGIFTATYHTAKKNQH